MKRGQVPALPAEVVKLTTSEEAQAWLDGCLARCDFGSEIAPCADPAVSVVETGPPLKRLRETACVRHRELSRRYNIDAEIVSPR